jgi:hypothetical protein
MLDACAPGHKVLEKKHHYWVLYNGETYRALPLGGHGKRNPEIQIGKIKQMIRQLRIDESCAKKHLPILG